MYSFYFLFWRTFYFLHYLSRSYVFLASLLSMYWALTTSSMRMERLKRETLGKPPRHLKPQWNEAFSIFTSSTLFFGPPSFTRFRRGSHASRAPGESGSSEEGREDCPCGKDGISGLRRFFWGVGCVEKGSTCLQNPVQSESKDKRFNPFLG